MKDGRILAIPTARPDNAHASRRQRFPVLATSGAGNWDMASKLGLSRARALVTGPMAIAGIQTLEPSKCESRQPEVLYVRVGCTSACGCVVVIVLWCLEYSRRSREEDELTD